MIKTDEKFNIDYIDASGMVKFACCPARYLFGRQMGLTAPNDNMVAPDYGTAMHRAFPYCYNGPTNIQQATAEFIAAWNKYNYGYVDEKRNPDTAEMSLVGFATTHSPSACPYKILNYPIDADTADIISPNEIPFMIDMGGELPGAGRIDLAVRWNDTGDLWSSDYKTASEISPRYFKCFEAACQPCMYTLALSMIANESAKGMIVEAVRTSKKSVENQIHFVFITERQIEVFLEFANQKSEEILRCNESGEWPQHPSNCSPQAMYIAPGRLCPYRTICDYKDWKRQVQYFKRSEPFHPFKVK